MRVSVVTAATDTECRAEPVAELVEIIRDGDLRPEIEAIRAAYAASGKAGADPLKKQLPAAMFSGVFYRRASDALDEHSGLICADLDHLGDGLVKVREKIVHDPLTFCAFASPTGTGIKVIFRCDPARPHIDSFRAAERYVKEQFGCDIDPACKDVSRLCFLSWDPDIYYAPNVARLPYPDRVNGSAPAPLVTGPAVTGGTPIADRAIDHEYGPPYVWSGGDEPKVIGFNGLHFAALFHAESEIKYDPASARFYLYEPKNGLWQPTTPETLKLSLGSLWLEIARGDGHENLAIRQRSDSTLSAWVNHLRGIAEEPQAFNHRPPGLLHVANGFVDVATGELLAFSPEHLSRNQSPLPFVPGATAPRFIHELLESALNPDDIRAIQLYAGMCLLGRNLAQRILVIIGTAGGGKSTLVTVLEQIVGLVNVTQLRTEQLAERFELFRLLDRTLLCGKDVPGDFLESKGAHVLKALVGGDLLEAEKKGASAGLQLRGDFCVIVTSNSRLRVKLDGDTGAWERRLIVIDYDRPKPAVPIPNFADVLLSEEGSGILNWCIEGAQSLLANDYDFRLTEAQRRRVFNLLAESDSIRAFVRDCIVSDLAADVTSDELCEAYSRYCDLRGWGALPLRAVERQLPDLLMESHRIAKRNDIRRNGKNARGFGRIRVEVPEISDAP